MPDLNDNDINEAKRRVREMNNRASRLFDLDDNKKEPEAERAPQQDDKPNKNDNDNSFLIILSLILILSQEGADNSLIFALLYLLL